MTDDLRRLLAEATPLGPNGPWNAEYVQWAVRHIVRNVDMPDWLPDTMQGWNYWSLDDRTGTLNAGHQDAALIVAAVNALPALLDVVEAAGEAADLATAGACDAAEWEAALSALRDALSRLEATR